MKTVCAWCNVVITPGEEPRSHGICRACAANQHALLNLLFAQGLLKGAGPSVCVQMAVEAVQMAVEAVDKAIEDLEGQSGAGKGMPAADVAAAWDIKPFAAADAADAVIPRDAVACTCKAPEWPKWDDANDRSWHMPGCPCREGVPHVD